AVPQQQAFVDTVPGAETGEAGAGEAREGSRRRRRGRGGRDRDETRQANGAGAELNGEAPAEAGFTAVPAADLDAAPISGSPAPGAEDGMPSAEGEREGGRRRRGRDRHRRERREDDVPSGVEAVSEAAALESPNVPELGGFELPREPAPIERFTLAEASSAPVLGEPAPTAPAAAAVPTPPAAHVESFVLPTDQLQAVAEAAGLQWVNSDAEKIRAVQEAMAAEPKPIHVPREPKPVVAIDEGPL